MVKKVKKLNRKGKVINNTEEIVDEKKEMIMALMKKCNKSEEEILIAYDEFHLKYENGSISKDDYISSSKVLKYY